MRKTPVFVALWLLVAAGPAAAQAPQAPKPAAAPAEERPRLNLKLDEPARFYTSETPREGADGKSAAGTLPSLGGNPVPSERPPAPRPERGSSPYPKDWETGR